MSTLDISIDLESGRVDLTAVDLAADNFINLAEALAALEELSGDVAGRAGQWEEPELLSQLETVKEQRDQAWAELDELHGQEGVAWLDELKGQRNRAEKKIEELRGDLEQRDIDLDDLNETVSALQAEIANLKDTLRVRENTIKERNETILGLYKQADWLRQQIASLGVDLSQWRAAGLAVYESYEEFEPDHGGVWHIPAGYESRLHRIRMLLERNEQEIGGAILAAARDVILQFDGRPLTRGGMQVVTHGMTTAVESLKEAISVLEQ